MAVVRSTTIGSGIGTISDSTTIATNTTGNAWYMEQMQREQHRRYLEEVDRLRFEAARQQQAYNPYTDTYGGVTAQQIQEGQKPKPMPAPEYLKNNKVLLLLEN